MRLGPGRRFCLRARLKLSAPGIIFISGLYPRGPPIRAPTHRHPRCRWRRKARYRPTRLWLWSDGIRTRWTANRISGVLLLLSYGPAFPGRTQRLKCWAELGYASLWLFLRKELGLSEAMASYRAAAAELVGRFPQIVEPLRDGRLCITNLIKLRGILTEENCEQVLGRAHFAAHDRWTDRDRLPGLDHGHCRLTSERLGERSTQTRPQIRSAGEQLRFCRALHVDRLPKARTPRWRGRRWGCFRRNSAELILTLALSLRLLWQRNQGNGHCRPNPPAAHSASRRGRYSR